MSDREKLPEWIDRFNNNELEGEELERFLALLKKNPKIQAEVDLDRDLNQVLKDEELLELRKKIQKVRERGNRTRPGDSDPGLRIWLMAALIVVLVGTVFLIFWLTRAPGIIATREQLTRQDTLIEREKSLPAVRQKDSTTVKKPVRQNLQLAQNLTPYPPLESLVGTVTRGSSFRLIKPLNSSIILQSSELEFLWKKDENEKVALTILDNTGKPVMGPILTADDHEKIKASRLKPGLYYFRIVNKDELIYVGKFTIK